ncbi:hypothetical protein SJAV_26860 [Sulfurisphaera javensis]|uniref:Uncharacterized protein n=1 Tax=Sulfurisphaera javensis TaxID=2049879 RepID=A0AAT9GV26_9CREN
MTKLCIKYDLSVEINCKDNGNYLYVTEVGEDSERIHIGKDQTYLKMVVKYEG